MSIVLNLIEFLIFIYQRLFQKIIFYFPTKFNHIFLDLNLDINIYNHKSVKVMNLYHIDGLNVLSLFEVYGPNIVWPSTIIEKKTFWEVYRYHWIDSFEEKERNIILSEYINLKTGYGPMYMNSMEVSLRLLNLYKYIPNLPDLKRKLEQDYYFIIKNLEVSFDKKTFKRYAYNHYIFGLIGLNYFKNNLVFSKLLYREIKYQFPEGFHFESSGHYHFFILSVLKSKLPDYYKKYKFLNGRFYFGDNDSGWHTINDIQTLKRDNQIFISNQIHYLCFESFKFSTMVGSNIPSGHSHSDLFSFNVFYKDFELIVNGSSYSYINQGLRQSERTYLGFNGPIKNKVIPLTNFDKLSKSQQFSFKLNDSEYFLFNDNIERTIRYVDKKLIINDLFLNNCFKYQLILRKRDWIKLNEVTFFHINSRINIHVVGFSCETRSLSFEYNFFEDVFCLQSQNKSIQLVFNN
jgi:hypothetical protein